MFTFAYTYLLWLLLLIPLMVIIWVWARYARKIKLERFGRKDSISSLMPEVSPYKPPIKITLQMIALLLIIFAVCRPWGGLKDEKTTKEGIEVVIAVDASNSMLASAGKDDNGVSRMRTAKTVLEKLINRLDNDRVGLIVYAGDAYTLIPVTGDYISAKMFLNSIEPSQITNQGTNISAAITTAANSFGDESKKTGKAIILITDAEDLEDQDNVLKVASNVADKGIQIDVVGVGTDTPVAIPTASGNMVDQTTGDVVRTALNEDLAASIAKAGKGIYVNASNSDALNELDKQLSTVKKTAMESSFYALHDELFPVFLWLALIFLVADIFMLERKIGWLDKITFFKKEEK